MKNIFSLIVYVAAILALSSCSLYEDEKPSVESKEVKTIVELPDTIKQKIVEQDALMTELLNKVDTLTTELNSTKAENSDLKKKISDLESPKRTLAYVSICAIVLGLLALAVAIFKPKGVKEGDVYDIVKNSIENSRRIKELQVNVNSLLSSQRSSKTPHASSSDVSNFEMRLHILEGQMAKVHTVTSKPTSSTYQSGTPSYSDTTRSREEHEYQKVGYAKVDTDMYFTTVYESNQEGCVFKINFTSQSKGRFNIISLDKIQSRNDWQKKVECSGVSIKDASDFRLEDEGICEKIDENTWKVTKPLKIRLLK